MSSTKYYCTACTRQVAKPGRQCATCSNLPFEYVKYNPRDGVEPGEWVLDPVRRIQVFKPKVVDTRKPPAVLLEHTRPCPHCHAQYGELCVTVKGDVSRTHSERLTACGMKKTCGDCDVVIHTNRRYCDEHRTERRRAMWRERQRRKTAALKARQEAA